MKQKPRGNIGLILVLISLLIAGILVFQNINKTGSVNVTGNSVGGSPQKILENFQNEANKIEKMQEPKMPDPNTGE